MRRISAKVVFAASVKIAIARSCPSISFEIEPTDSLGHPVHPLLPIQSFPGCRKH